MNLQDLQDLLTPSLREDARDLSLSIEVSGLASDSRDVRPGFVFAAIPGTVRDGRTFLNDAAKRGAVAGLVPTDTSAALIPPAMKVVRVDDVRQTLAQMAALFFPRQPPRIGAVTGTSGKTSTVHLAREMAKALGFRAASLGTLGLIGPGCDIHGIHTTPDPIALHRTLQALDEDGVTHVALEASSHGLAQSRMDGVRLAAAAFTSWGRDHLDFHATPEAYLAAKMRLFRELLPPGGGAVLNTDLPFSDELAAICRTRGHNVILYGHHGADLSLTDVTPSPGGQRMTVRWAGTPRTILLPLAGRFQAMNALAAMGLLMALGAPAEALPEALAHVPPVPGRLQDLGTTARGGRVFVDYAHKPDALENVLSDLRLQVDLHPGAKLVVVFGCGGDRDVGKRPLMGALAQRLADEVIVTDDNPRSEDPAAIRAAIRAGCVPGPTLLDIGDRQTAIEEALARLGPGDLLVVAGKGHEAGQIIGNRMIPFDDGDVIRAALKAQGGNAEGSGPLERKTS